MGKKIPEHASPASGGPDGVSEDWVNPCSHEEGVKDIRLKLGALCNCSRHNGASSGSELCIRSSQKGLSQLLAIDEMIREGLVKSSRGDRHHDLHIASM